MQSGTTTDGDPITIDITDPTIKWRYTCPRSHTTFQPTNGGIWCRSCELDDDVENAHYSAVKDQRQNVLIDFERVVLLDGDKRWA